MKIPSNIQRMVLFTLGRMKSAVPEWLDEAITIENNSASFEFVFICTDIATEIESFEKDDLVDEVTRLVDTDVEYDSATFDSFSVDIEMFEVTPKLIWETQAFWQAKIKESKACWDLLSANEKADAEDVVEEIVKSLMNNLGWLPEDSYEGGHAFKMTVTIPA